MTDKTKKHTNAELTEEQLEQANGGAVFEPNDEPLWAANKNKLNPDNNETLNSYICKSLDQI